MRTLSLLTLLFFATSSWAQEGAIPSNLLEKIGSEASSLLENKEYITKNISVTAADNTKTYKSLRDLDTELKKGSNLYKQGKYDEAHPIIAELSQWGLKSAQSLLGTMYIKGQHVDRSVERGLAWLGVSNELGGSKSSKANFDYVYKQLNDEQRKIMDSKIQSYIAMYGAETQHISCKRKKTSGSNIQVKAKSCSKRTSSNSPLHPIE
jgi:TPR repeat protein